MNAIVVKMHTSPLFRVDDIEDKFALLLEVSLALPPAVSQ